ncbi:MAG: low-specificity L-threonine aldolase [Firmicutes bacterium]|nr:low-specificity L-threonine aldolase [Bacillota bacterium]
MKVLDFRSDTLTQPSAAMRAFMAQAQVGDDVYGEDPSINLLEMKAAELTGFASALFISSGTQGNLIALLSHCRPGDEVILEEDSHIFVNEVGGMAALGGLQARTLRGLPENQGIFPVEAMISAIRADNVHYPETTLVCLENTHNKGGGAAATPQEMGEIIHAAQERGIKVHLYGARALSASVAQKPSIAQLLKGLDSVQICLSKGLGAPVGSVLLGDPEFIKRARKWRKMLGGGMRQAGILAAAGLYAFEHNIDRLEEDHQRAQILAEVIDEIPGLQVLRPKIMTNILCVDTRKSQKSGAQWVEILAQRGIRIGANGPFSIRFVTHLDIDDEDLAQAIKILREI